MKLEKYCDEILKGEQDFHLAELIQEIEFTGRSDIPLLRKLVDAAYNMGMEDAVNQVMEGM